MKMHAAALLLACATLSSALSPPRVLNPPSFSFDHLGNATFAHITKTTLFNASDLALLSRFPMVQFDKGQYGDTYPHMDQEDRFILAAKDVRKAHPNVTLLFYINLLIDFPFFERIHNTTSQDESKYILHDTHGDETITLPHHLTYNIADADMRSLFISDCLYGVRNGFDGCFIDRANYGMEVLQSDGGVIPGRHWDMPTTVAVVNASLQDHIILAKETNGVPFSDRDDVNAMMLTDTFCSSYKNAYDAAQCRVDILGLQAAAKRKQLVQCHGLGPLDDDAQREFVMACFLVGFGELSYFSHAATDGAWTLNGTRWWPEYDLPLGAPLGDASVSSDGWVFSREFASGTAVTVDVLHHTAHITWASQ